MITPRINRDGTWHPMDRWIAYHRRQNGKTIVHTEAEQNALHAQSAANMRANLLQQCDADGEAKLRETDAELAELTARAVANPLQRPALQQLLDYRDAVQARRSAIPGELAAIPIPAWGPGDDGTGTKTDYDPQWPAR